MQVEVDGRNYRGNNVFENNFDEDLIFISVNGESFDCESAIIVCDPIARNICNAVTTSGQAVLIGNIMKKGLSKNNACISDIYRLIQNNICLVIVNEKLNDYLVPRFTNIVCDHISHGVLLYDGLNKNLCSNIDVSKSPLRLVKNSFVHDKIVKAFGGIQTLEVGNVVDNLLASFCSKCECSSKYFIGVLSIKNSTYDMEASMAFSETESGLHVLLNSAQSDARQGHGEGGKDVAALETKTKMDFGDLSFYRSMMQKDTFLFNTENMFT